MHSAFWSPEHPPKQTRKAEKKGASKVSWGIANIQMAPIVAQLRHVSNLLSCLCKSLWGHRQPLDDMVGRALSAQGVKEHRHPAAFASFKSFKLCEH